MTRTKPSYASDTQNPVNGTHMSLARRQLHGIFAGPVFWIIIAAVTFIAAMAGPYFTLTRFSFPERLVYWATTIILSSTLMTVLSVFAYWATHTSRLHWIVVSTLAGMTGVLPVVGTLYLGEGLATGFAQGWNDSAYFTTFVLSVAPTLVFVTIVVHALIRHIDHPQPSQTVNNGDQAETPPALTLLQRKLPHHLGHDIICVQAKDHYVQVTTPKGSAMVLMGLGDAVKDLEPLHGMQVHRSWWINLDHIAQIKKGASGPELVLSSGQRTPVGRVFRSAFFKATDRVSTTH